MDTLRCLYSRMWCGSPFYFKGRKEIHLLVLLVFVTVKLVAQNTGPQKAINSGEAVPDHTFARSINLKEKSIGEFKGKLLILDFWTTFCSSCVATFPKLQKLQKDFDKEIQIVLVNDGEKEEVIRKFIDRRKEKFDETITLPIVYSDTLLKKYFPHTSVPHVAWIDKNGVFRTTTRSDVVNEKNIKALLEGNMPSMQQKTDERAKWDVYKPLYKDGNGGDGGLLAWRSYLGSFDPKLIGTQFVVANDEQGYCITSTNTPIPGLYRYAYSNRLDESGNLLLLPECYTLLMVSDETKYNYMKEGEIQYEKIYTYQLNAAPSTKEQLLDMMKEDLKRFFGLDAQWKSVVRDCLVLKATDTLALQYETGEKYIDITDTGLRVNNITVKELVNYLMDNTEFFLSPYQIIDETGFKGKLKTLDFDIHKDYKKFSAGLERFGLSLSLEKRQVDVLVLSEPSVN